MGGLLGTAVGLLFAFLVTQSLLAWDRHPTARERRRGRRNSGRVHGLWQT